MAGPAFEGCWTDDVIVIAQEELSELGAAADWLAMRSGGVPLGVEDMFAALLEGIDPLALRYGLDGLTSHAAFVGAADLSFPGELRSLLWARGQ
jgi:hypothetical protein